MVLAESKANNQRSGWLILASAVTGGLVAWFWAGSILAGFIGWMGGGVAGSAAVSYLDGKRATSYLFLLSTILLLASILGFGRLDGIWLVILILSGIVSGAIGSQIEKENLDAC